MIILVYIGTIVTTQHFKFSTKCARSLFWFLTPYIRTIVTTQQLWLQNRPVYVYLFSIYVYKTTTDGSCADVALYLVKNYPDLVTERNTIYSDLVTALQVLAAKPYAFQSGCKLGFWQRIIYSCKSCSVVIIYICRKYLFLFMLLNITFQLVRKYYI